MTDILLDSTNAPPPFQARVQPWLMACFGEMIAGDRDERNHRFLEEALELVQACGCSASEAHQLVDYVFGRDVGDPPQEVGGVMVTLAALCLANDLDMHANAEAELARIWTKVEAIRAKQAAKPKHSPLPMHVSAVPQIEGLKSGEDRAGAIERAARYVLGSSRRGTASLNSEQFDADSNKLMTAYRDIIGKAIDSGALFSPKATASERKCYRHAKRGTVYEVIGTAELQAGQPQFEHADLVIYRGEDGKLWARNSGEFHDGRFILADSGNAATIGGEVA